MLLGNDPWPILFTTPVYKKKRKHRDGNSRTVPHMSDQAQIHESLRI
jgi:hypothetical protein